MWRGAAPDAAQTPYPSYKNVQIQQIVLCFVGLISVAHQAISPTVSMWREWGWITYDLPAVPVLHLRWWCAPDAR
ncbi:hypothetical protein AWP53_05685 [Escherichia coli]|nr:hypothetical protein AWP53_05685 [Escherichia coli]